LAALIESQKSAEALTVALEALNRELDKYEYRQRLSNETPTDHVSSLYEAANALQQHHQDSITQLQDLTASLGLLHMPVPSTVSETDKSFIKHLILLHAVKTTLWNRLQRLQNELNPIRESSARSGAGKSIGNSFSNLSSFRQLIHCMYQNLADCSESGTGSKESHFDDRRYVQQDC
jgi:hypothetical protein